MSVYSLPNTDISEVKAEDPQAVLGYISPVIDHLLLAPSAKDESGKVVYPSLDFKVHSAVYTLIYNATTSSRAHNSAGLYKLIADHITEDVKKIGEAVLGDGSSGEALLSRYLEAWTRFDNRATYLDRISAYLNRHYVRREEDEGRGARIILTVWGYPGDGVSKEAAETCSKAASGDDALVPVRPLALRKWRVLVAEKLNMESIAQHLKSLQGSQRETVVEELRKSFWTVGVEPTNPPMTGLTEFMPKAPEPPKTEVLPEPAKEGASAPAEASAGEGSSAGASSS